MENVKNTWRGFSQKIKGINKNLNTIEEEIRERALPKKTLKALSYLEQIKKIVKTEANATIDISEEAQLNSFFYGPQPISGSYSKRITVVVNYIPCDSQETILQG